MSKLSPSQSDEATRRAARILAILCLLATIPVVISEIVFVPEGTWQVSAPLSAAVALSMFAFLWIIQGGGSWRILVAPAVIVLDVGALLCGALLPIGNDFAIILPMLSAILLVGTVEGRPLRFGLFAGWLFGVAGSSLARTGPILSTVPHASPPVHAEILLAATTGVGYLVLSWAASHLHAVAAAAHAAADQASLAEAAQQHSAERFRALVDQSPLPTVAFDTEGHIQEWNPAAERYLGWTADEVRGWHVSSLVPEAIRGRVEARVRETIASGQTDGTRMTTFLTRQGGEMQAEIHDAVELGLDGKPTGVVVQFIDVTEREQISQRLIEAQRLESVGLLAGGVAHDFNNSLTAIGGFASLIATGESPDPRDDARTILGAAEHAAILTRQLLAFSRRVPLQPRTLDLRDFLATVEPLVRSLIGETIVLRRESDNRPALAEVDAATLEQAILNLSANARDAMPQGGELTLAVRAFPACVGGLSEEPEDHVAVIVSDTGAGIPQQMVTRVFEPFFTTKPPGKGTGLGLPMVHGFMAQSGGHVVVKSPPGQGATLELHFPRAVGGVARAEARAQPVGGTESVLFVEDDPGVASFGLACLRRLGYDVTPTMNGTGRWPWRHLDPNRSTCSSPTW